MLEDWFLAPSAVRARAGFDEQDLRSFGRPAFALDEFLALPDFFWVKQRGICSRFRGHMLADFMTDVLTSVFGQKFARARGEAPHELMGRSRMST